MSYTPKVLEFHEARETLSFEHFDARDIIGAYVARYPPAYRFTLGFEGGYVNDERDPGGCTYKGITIGTFRDWRGDNSLTCQDLANLSDVEIGMIYALNYWAPVWGNQLPVGINTQVWDFGVNAGPYRAISTLQKCVPTSVDGVMGPNTLAAVKAADFMALMTDFHVERQAYYESLSTFDTYGNGWTRRNDECYELGLNLAAIEVEIPRMPDEDLSARIDRLEQWVLSFGV